MLCPPYTRYDRLYVYHLDKKNICGFTDPDLIGVWIEDETAILFFHKEKSAVIDRLCHRCSASVVYQAELGYEEWEAGVTITSFATKTLHIRPVWEPAADIPAGEHEIILDPSVIFGSGFHATTRLCLETLELLLMESGLVVNSVLDLGTGTGLLAIAAAKLGVKRVCALDNNPLAIEVARKNVALNSCEKRVDVQCFDLMKGLPDMEFDLVITNLYKGLLIHLFDQDAFWHDSIYLVSGFIPSMEEELLAALPARKVHMLHRANSDQWRLWLLQFGADPGKKKSVC